MIRKFTNKNKVGNISFSIFTDCNELPMLRFINILCNNEIKYLVKEGNPPQDVLKQTWEHIYEQYLNLCSGDDSVIQYVLQLKIERKQLFVEMLHSIRECISEGYHIVGFNKKVAVRLNNLMKIMKTGERFTLDPENLAAELQTLRIITNETTLEYNELKNELKGYQNGSENKQLTSDHFYQWSTSMSTYFKFNIQLSVCTVSEFESYRKQYKEAVQREQVAKASR